MDFWYKFLVDQLSQTISGKKNIQTFIVLASLRTF